MTCDDIRPLLADRRDLTFAQEQLVRTHLHTCRACAMAWQCQERGMRMLRGVTVAAPSVSPARLTSIRAVLAPPQRRRGWPAPGGNGRVALLATLCVSPLLVYLLVILVVAQPDGPPTAMPTTARQPAPQTTLYVVGTVMNRLPAAPRGTRLTAIDRTTWQERYRIGGVDEATLSPNGTRLYTAGRSAATTGDDQIRAFDATDGQEVWTTTLAQRAEFPGQQNLLVSPDGRWLYVRSYDVAQGTGNATTVPFWLQIIDTRDGRLLNTTIALPTIDQCGAPRLMSPPVGTLAYVSCYNGDIYAVDATTQRLVQPFATPTSGLLFPIHTTELATVSTGLRVTRLDAATQAVRSSVTLQAEPALTPTLGALSLSGDGTRVAAGQTIQGVPGTDTATELAVFDASSGEQLGRWRYERPLQQLAVDASGQTLYGLWTELSGTDSTIVEFALPTGTQRTVHARAGEATTQLFLGP